MEGWEVLAQPGLREILVPKVQPELKEHPASMGRWVPLDRLVLREPLAIQAFKDSLAQLAQLVRMG